MSAARYFDLVREMRDAYNHRLRLVHYARRQGIKPAARAFATTVPTVRKWLRRYQQHGPSGLRELSRAHHDCPHKTPLALEQQVIALRQKLPTFGASRLKREFDLPLSHMAIHRIWRQHGLIRKRRKKYQRKQDLSERRIPGQAAHLSALLQSSASELSQRTSKSLLPPVFLDYYINDQGGYDLPSHP